LREGQFKNGHLEKELVLSKLKTTSIWKAKWNKGSTRSGIKVKELMLSSMRTT